MAQTVDPPSHSLAGKAKGWDFEFLVDPTRNQVMRTTMAFKIEIHRDLGNVDNCGRDGNTRRERDGNTRWGRDRNTRRGRDENTRREYATGRDGNARGGHEHEDREGLIHMVRLGKGKERGEGRVVTAHLCPLTRLELASTVLNADTDTREVEPSSRHARTEGAAGREHCAFHGLGTAGVESASGTEKAVTA
jgi:hypothetical protein